MGFLISHWHCILPIMGVVIAILLLKDKGEGQNEKENKNI